MAGGDASLRDAARVAEDAFVFAYPLVLTAVRSELSQSPAAARDRPDAIPLSASLDLGAEPIVLSTPDTRGRFYVLWVCDAWNAPCASVGARTTGTGPRTFALLGPGRHGTQLPPDMTPIVSRTRLVRIAGSIEALSDIDRYAAERIEDAFRVAPLSRWRHAGASLAEANGAAASPVERLERMDAETFFATAARLLADNPPQDGDQSRLDRLLALGATPEARAAIAAGVEQGRALVRAESERPRGEPMGSWRLGFEAARYGKRELHRAAAARAGSDTDSAADELPATLSCDADGRPLTGDDRYLLRFAPDGSPPVNGYWSLATYALTENGRPEIHATGDRRGLTLDPDGSLSIHVQRTAPGRGRAANWLPAPRERFKLVLRLYWPCDEVLERRWCPPAVVRLRP